MTNGTATMNLEIAVSDPDLCAELAQYPSGSATERAEFAITAMKIGSWPSARPRAASTPNRFAAKATASLANLGQALTSHQKEVTKQIANKNPIPTPVSRPAPSAPNSPSPP